MSFTIVLDFSGKILSDDTKISDYDIDEKKFVVIMVTKVSIFFPVRFVTV